MTETISMTFDSDDLKEFKSVTGMSIVAYMKLLMDNVKYGGKPGLDPFWSEENQKYLDESIREFKAGKVVEFSAEEWEKFVNETGGASVSTYGDK